MVRVSVPDGDATGFVVDRRGLVVSACHAVAGKERIFVESAGTRYPARILRSAPAWDLALLEIQTASPRLHLDPGENGPPASSLPFLHALEFADGMAAPLPLPVMAASAAEGASISVRTGKIMRVGVAMNGVALLEAAMAVEPGDSGAPVLDGAGRVVGVVAAMRLSGGGAPWPVAYILPSNYLFDGADALMRGHGRTVPLGSSFLWYQLRSLADLESRGLPARGIAASQAFVTGSRYLAVVAECPVAGRLSGERAPVDVWVRSERGDLLVDAVVDGWVARGSGRAQAPGTGIYFYFRLTREEYSGILRAGGATVEVRCDRCLLVRHLPLNAE